jgi:hypothetical protein
MSYNASAHYVAETFIKNRPDWLLKPMFASYLAENGHDIRQMTKIENLRRKRRNAARKKVIRDREK